MHFSNSRGVLFVRNKSFKVSYIIKDEFSYLMMNLNVEITNINLIIKKKCVTL